MKILSIFVITNYGATIVSAHQPRWFLQTSYQNLHEAYLDSPVAQRFITQLAFDKITQLRNKDDFFYLRKVSLTDDRILVYVTDKVITDIKTMEYLFERIQKSIGNVHDLSGIKEKEKSIEALTQILEHPDVAVDQKPSMPVIEEKPKVTSHILFFGPKEIPKLDDSDWDYLWNDKRGGLYEMD